MTRATTIRRRKALLRAAEQAIRERYAEFDLTLADVAEAIGCSPRGLQRVFREVADTDFRSALFEVRMEHAHRLLSRERHPLPVHVVAPRVGYRNVNGLRQAFVRYFGFNPSQIQPEPRDADYDRSWKAAEANSRRGPSG